jgi:hypothetical protein
VVRELAGGVDDGSGDCDRFGCFGRLYDLIRKLRVFQFVSSPAHGAVRLECGSELADDGLLDGVVAAGGGGSEALLGEQPGARESRGVVGEGVGGVGICTRELFST